MAQLLDPLASAPGARRPSRPDPEQGVIEEARRRQRQRRLGIAIALPLVAALGALIMFAVGEGRAHPSAKPADSPGRAPAADPAAHSQAFNVRLSPVLAGGEAGWCTVIEEAGKVSGGSCGGVPTPPAAVLNVDSNYSAGSHQESVVVVTTPAVAAIDVDGRYRARTRTFPGLPYGLRAARVVIPVERQGIASPPPRYEGTALVLLDAHGQPLRQAPLSQAPRLTSESWQRPSPAPPAPCTLGSGGLSGLSAQWGHLATAVEPFPGQIVGRALLSCADTEYYLNDWPLDAAILLDAAHPGARPAAIPDLQAVAGHAGFFNGPGSFHGGLTAKRSGNAWLVVEGGSGLRQRLEVLRHLRASIHL